MKNNLILVFLLTFTLSVFAQPTDSLSADASVSKSLEPDFVSRTPVFIETKDSMEKIGFAEPEPEPGAEVYTHEAFVASFLIGQWQRIGEHYKAILSFNDESYLLEKYFSESDSKMEENYMNYVFMQDSVVLKGITNNEQKSAFWIRKLTPDTLVLQDPESFAFHKFIRITTDMPTMPKREKEIYLQNNVLTCMTNISTVASNQAECLHIGELDFSWKLDSIAAVFGPEVRFVQSKKDSAIAKHVFNLKSFQGTQPELIITHNRVTNEVIEIQLRGFGTVENLAFSSIRLGDYISYIEQKLGKPTDKQFDNETLTTKWSYAPYPLVFEFKNKYVNGIKLIKPSEMER